MKLQLGCYHCLFKQMTMLAKESSDCPDAQLQLLRKLLREFADAAPEVTPPEFAARFYGLWQERTGITDPYRHVKDRSTELAQSLMPDLRRIITDSNRPFEHAVRLAIGGNIIDYGVNPAFDLDSAEAAIREVLHLPLDPHRLSDLEKRLDQADSIFYMLDNCGEAVIDRLLIERYRNKITIGVRGKPIFNDITRRELAASGLADLPTVDTGTMVPGVSLSQSSPELLETMRRADLVLAKGQGNFESLDGYDRPIYFLFRVKCQVLSQQLGAPLGALQIIGKNLHA